MYFVKGLLERSASPVDTHQDKAMAFVLEQNINSKNNVLSFHFFKYMSKTFLNSYPCYCSSFCCNQRFYVNLKQKKIYLILQDEKSSMAYTID